MYKVGDKVLCKKNVTWETEDTIFFIKGKRYTITNDLDGYYSFIDEEKDNHDISKDFISECFYTKSEIRKLKLEKLQCIK